MRRCWTCAHGHGEIIENTWSEFGRICNLTDQSLTQFLRAALIPIRHVHRLVIHMTGWLFTGWLFTGWLLVLINQPAYAQPQVGYSSSQVGYSQVGYSQVGYSQVGYSPQVVIQAKSTI